MCEKKNKVGITVCFVQAISHILSLKVLGVKGLRHLSNLCEINKGKLRPPYH